MNKPQEGVQFSGRIIGFFGLLTGVCVAVGLPALVLIFGQGLGVAIQTLLIILSIIFGSAIGIILGFFAIVIPSSVSNQLSTRPKIKIQKNGENKVVEINPGACEDNLDAVPTRESE